MKTTFSGRTMGTAAALAICALPFTSEAGRYASHQGVSPAAPAAARPAVPQPAPVVRPAAPQRPAYVPRPSTPAVVSRPAAPQRPSYVPRPSAPAVVSRPDAPQRPSYVPLPSAPSIVSRPAAPQRPSFVPGNSASRTPTPSYRPSVPSVSQQRPSGNVADSDRFRDSHRGGSSTYQRPPSTVPSITDFRDRDSRSSSGGFSRHYTPGSSSSDSFRRSDSTVATRYPSRPGSTSVARASHFHFTDSSRFSHTDHSLAYQCYPRQHYRLNYCDGYRGLGWYFGPPNFSYYYQSPSVVYYSSRELIPSTYMSLMYSEGNSIDYAVQQTLAELGYYDGPLDGDIGPLSRMAIANFQADNGLEPTGLIDETLLNYLGLE